VPKTPPADPEATSTATTTTGSGTTLAAVAATVDKLAEKVELVIGALHKDAGSTTDERLGASTSVAEQVQEELARRDEATKRAEAERDLGNIKETITKLTEKVPEQPVRRVERLMGWRNA
jgi:hypothetical protein